MHYNESTLTVILGFSVEVESYQAVKCCLNGTKSFVHNCGHSLVRIPVELLHIAMSNRQFGPCLLKNEGG